jgi:hypothetical protein
MKEITKDKIFMYNTSNKEIIKYNNVINDISSVKITRDNIGIVSLDVLILFIVYKNNNIKIFVINKFLLTIINILFIKNMILKILAA